MCLNLFFRDQKAERRRRESVEVTKQNDEDVQVQFDETSHRVPAAEFDQSERSAELAVV